MKKILGISGVALVVSICYLILELLLCMRTVVMHCSMTSGKQYE